MKLAKRYVVFFAVLVLLLQVQVTTPCDGTLNPPCSRAIYLAKFAPQTVVLPASGPINVPIGLLPFVSWDATNTNQCAQPSSASLTLTLTCTPVGGGTPVVVGPLNITVPTPTTPGPQTNINSPVTVTIPAGSVTSPSVCLVQGTYSVTFGGGGSLGAGTLSGSGDVEVCIVEPSPYDPLIPRLSFERIPLEDGDPGYTACRRGDQVINYFLVSNNDPDNGVTFSFTSKTKQVAGLPDNVTEAEAADMQVRAISSPVPGTDAFPQDFVFNCALIDLPNPSEVSDRAITMDFTLGPKEATIVPVGIRSYGRCLDGSCNEQTAKIEGTFSDGTPALACASTLLLVDDVPAKTPLCEFEDFLLVGPNTDGIFGPAHFLDAAGKTGHVATHTIGNVLDFFDVPGRATWVRGESFNDPLNPSTSNDYVRAAPDAFVDANYTVEFFSQLVDFVPVINNVTLTGLANIPGSTEVPMIAFNDGNFDPLDIMIDIGSNTAVVNRSGSELFNGNFGDLFSNPPSPFVVSFGGQSSDGGRRQFSKTGGNDIAIQSDRTSLIFISPSIINDPGSTQNLLNFQQQESDTLQITDQNGTPVSYTATVRGNGVTLPSGSGTGELIVSFNPDGLDLVPNTPLAFIDITSPDAINNPLTIPVAFRVDTSTVSSVNDEEPIIPQTTALAQNYPNPFNPTTVIRYQVNRATRVELRIYNQLGQEIRSLVNENQPAGSYQVEWDGLNNAGARVSSGIYLYRLKTGDTVQTRKMLLLK